MALVFVLLVLSLTMQSVPAGATWEGTHRFSLAVQGSINSMDQVSSTSQSIPVEFRATISITVDRMGSSGDHLGRLRITDGYVHQDGEMLPLSVSSAGYRILLRADGAHEVLDDTFGLSMYGVDLNEILNVLFPVPQGQSLQAGASWGTEYVESLQVDDRILAMPMEHTFTVNEVRDSIVVAQSSLRGSASIDLNPGRLTAEQRGSGVLHIDPETGNLIRSAVTVRSTIERSTPLGSLTPQEHSVLRALVTTSVERLEAAREPIPSLGSAYTDPAGRFSVRLPEGWDTRPVHLDHSLTVFSNNDQTELLFIEIEETPSVLSPLELAEGQLAQYARSLVDFQVLTPAVERTWKGHPAAFAEYQFWDGAFIQESALYTQVDGYNLALQYLVQGAVEQGAHLLDLLADHFDLGPTPAGRVDTEQLILSPTILYEYEPLALEIQMPMLWPPVESDDAGLVFMELGGAGRLTIHLENVAPEESPVTLLSEWAKRLTASDPNVRVVSQARQDALGPLSAASVVVDWFLEDGTVRQKIVASNLEGILYVVTVEYAADGFDEREAAFERMLSSFQPRLDYLLAHLNTFNAYDPPPAPEGDEPFLVIGRFLHEYTAGDRVLTEPAEEVRVDLSIGDMSYVAIADSEGFFYTANLPVEPGSTITIDSIRGRLFGLPYDVHVPLGVTLTVQEQVVLVGELVIVLSPDGAGLSLRPETGFDPVARTSRVHQAFLNRYPDSPWSELVRQDLERRLAN